MNKGIDLTMLIVDFFLGYLQDKVSSDDFYKSVEKLKFVYKSSHTQEAKHE